MLFVINDPSPVFQDPANVPVFTGSNPNTVVATAPSGVQVGGTAQTYTTVAAPAGQAVQLVLSGNGTRVNVASGTAKIAAVGGGAIVESAISGTVSTGARTIELGNSNVDYNGGVVATAAEVSGNGSGTQSIAQAAGGIVPDVSGTMTTRGFAYYGAGGSGNDGIEGSSLNDFIRGGAGSDTINGFGGNDLIRGGAGSDIVSFGNGGNDTLYYTSDQLDGSTDTVTDFVSGQDKIAVDRTAVGSIANISGLNSNTITFTASGTKVISNQDPIKAADIRIVDINIV